MRTCGSLTERATLPRYKSAMYASQELFEGIRVLLAPYATRGYTVTEDTGSMFTVVSKNEVVMAGRKFPEIYFAAVRKGKSGTVFHYFPVYADAIKFVEVDEGMKKCLKGKCCFHFKKFDSQVEGWVKEALESADAAYQRLGWVKVPSSK